MSPQPRIFPEREESGGDPPGFERRQPNARHVSMIENSSKQVIQSIGLIKIFPIAAEVNTRQNRFLVAEIVHLLDLAHNVAVWSAAPLAARQPGNTKAAFAITAILDLDKGACTAQCPNESISAHWLKVKCLKLGQGLPGYG